MKRGLTVFAFFLLLTACGGGGGSSPGIVPSNPLSSSAAGTPFARESITADVPTAAGVSDAGRMAPATLLHLVVNLRYQHAGELDRHIALVSTKGSGQYHHFLTNEEWNSYYAPSAETVAAVSQRLQRAGFQIESTSSDRSVIDIVAPVSSVERYFNTQIHNVVQAGAGTRYRNASSVTMPQELRDSVIAINGFDNLQLHHPVPIERMKPLPKIGGAITAPDGGYGPVVLANGYNYPVQHGYNGAGRTVGITIPTGYFLDSDTAAYLKYFGIKPTGHVTRENIDGGASSGQFDGESTLDVETVSGLAPGANIIVYIPPDWTVRYVNDTFNRIVAENKVDSFSNSWGWCETDNSGRTWNMQAIHQILQQAALKGITAIFSSGDDGSGTRGCTGNAVSSPANDPYGIAVGGLTIGVDAKGKLVSQSAWSGGGGGVSKVFARPTYQADIAGTISTGRNVPDIALPGDLEDAWYIAGGWNGPIGGTSWSAPAFNAMLVEINEALQSRSGFLNPSMYDANGSLGSRVFTDITSGSNGAFSAHRGFDQVTGLGAPNGMGLATYL